MRKAISFPVKEELQVCVDNRRFGIGQKFHLNGNLRHFRDQQSRLRALSRRAVGGKSTAIKEELKVLGKILRGEPGDYLATQKKTG